MARTDSLTNFLTDVAESIRTKEGTTEQISADEFDTRIANIPSGDTTNEDALIIRNRPLFNEYSNNRVTTVGKDAFHGMAYLKNISLPNVTTVDVSAFQGICYSGQDGDYTVIDLPKATTLGSSAFDSTGAQYNAGYLKYNLPEALSFGNRCFGYTSAITHINPEDETATRFVYAPKIQSIGDSCFTNSNHLTYADLKNVTSIGSYAFGGTELKTLVLRGEQVCTLGGALGSNGTNIYVPTNLIEDYKSSTNWSKYADNIGGIDVTSLAIACENINTYLTNTSNIKVLYNGLTVPLYKAEQGDYELSITGNATLEENTITLTEGAKAGDIITVTATSTYDNTITCTKEIEVFYEEIKCFVDLNNGQWVDSGTTVDGNIVYKSDAGSYYTNNGTSVAILTVRDCTRVKLYIRSYAESGYDYTEAFAIDTTAVRGNGLYTTKNNQSSTDYVECVYDLDGGTHTIEIMYSKDTSGNKHDDRGYFYIGEVS